MIKIVPPGAFDFGEQPLRLVKLSRRGLGPNDARGLLKRASSGFVDALRRLERLPGEELAHNIALGATEYFGPNRNGDGFKEAECRLNHGTFVTHGRAFRDHRNQDPAKSYGVIKLAHYNEALHRIELAIAYNATKEAAARNGGLVADLELADLADGGEFPSSMATRIAYDVCSGCGNRARHRREYCAGPTCKYGGLRDNIGRTFADGHTLHADNPGNTWFDMSRVGRGADRTSYTLGLVEKAARALLSGAELAEEYGLADAALPRDYSPLLIKSAEAAAALAGARIPADGRLAAFDPRLHRPLPAMPGAHARPEKLAAALRGLADERVVLPPREFFALASGDRALAEKVGAAVGPLVRRAYGAVLDAGDELLAANPYRPAAGPAPRAAALWASKAAEDYGLSPGRVARRVALASVRGLGSINVNRAAPLREAAGELALHYALYKTAAVRAFAGDPSYPRLIEAAALQDAALA